MGAKPKIADAILSLNQLTTKFELAAELCLDTAKRAALDYIKQTRRFNDRTGALRQSFEEAERTRFTLSLEPRGGPERYAGFVEHGTKFIRPRRFAAVAQSAGENALYDALERRLAALTAR